MQLPGNPYRFPKNLALFGACCFLLSAIEYMIPKPLPFLRIGLANLPLMLALNIFPLPAYIVLVCIKVIGQALITGTLFSYIFLFSAGGTFCSAMLMFALRRILKDQISFTGIGAAGAMISAAAQLLLAWFFIFKESVRYIAPPFLAAGLVTGVALGVFCEIFVKRSVWYADQKADSREQTAGSVASNLNNSLSNKKTYILFILGIIITLAILFNPNTMFRVFAFVFLWLLALIIKKAGNPITTVLVVAVIIVFNLLIPYGFVLFSIGPFAVTQGALTAGIHRAVTFQALVMLSKLTIRDNLKLPGTFGKLLSESLRIFSIIMNKKIRFSKNIIKDIDNLLINCGNML
jgi:heptaprenyl diphosphate synthase